MRQYSITVLGFLLAVSSIRIYIRLMKISDLKILAVISMLIDHFAFILGWFDAPLIWLNAMRMFGRTSFPLFCFCLAVGWKKTHDKQAYFTRLMICAAASQIPYSLVFGSVPAHQDTERALHFAVNWPLLWVGAVCALLIIALFRKSDHRKAAIPAALVVCIIPALRLSYGNICIFYDNINVVYTFLLAVSCIAVIDSLRKRTGPPALMILSLAAVAAAVYLLGNSLDFDPLGIALIVVMYYLPDRPMLAGAAVALWSVISYGLIDGNWMYCLAVILPVAAICFYNGQQGISGKEFKRFYYIFYPLHLALFGLIPLLQ